MGSPGRGRLFYRRVPSVPTHENPPGGYRSVEALIRDVDHHLNGDRLTGIRDTLRYPVAKFVARHRRAVGGGFARLHLDCRPDRLFHSPIGR